MFLPPFHFSEVSERVGKDKHVWFQAFWLEILGNHSCGGRRLKEHFIIENK